MTGLSLKRSPVAPVADPSPPRRLGLILLSTDLTTERDFAAAYDGTDVIWHGARIRYCNPTTGENLRATLPELADAAALLPAVPLAAIGYGCVSASVVLGDRLVRETINAVRPDVPVITPIAAAETALRALGARRIAVLTPYLESTSRDIHAHFAQRGYAQTDFHFLGLGDDGDMGRLDPEMILRAAAALDVDNADAVFISCTAVPALGVIPRIEETLSRPVVSANQALLWRMSAGLARQPDVLGRTRLGAIPAPALDG